MSTLKILEDGTRLFTNGKSHLGDGLLFGLVANQENMSDKEANDFLDKAVHQNTCVDDFVQDVKEHSCPCKVITDDDEGVKLGFKCKCGTKWRIPLSDFKAYMHHKRDLRETLRTTEGRREWVKQFSDKPTEGNKNDANNIL